MKNRDLKSVGCWTEKMWDALFPIEKIGFIAISALHAIVMLYIYLIIQDIDWMELLVAFLTLVSYFIYVHHVDKICMKRFESRKWRLEHRRG